MGSFAVERAPCRTCPYRCDTPPGIWDASEYERLRAWDAPTAEQPAGVFLCHHTTQFGEDATLCRGWLDTHGFEALGVRLALASGRLDPAVLDEEPAVAVYGSGSEAAAAGLSGVDEPSPQAQQASRRLERTVERRAAGAPTTGTTCRR